MTHGHGQSQSQFMPWEQWHNQHPHGTWQQWHQMFPHREK